MENHTAATAGASPDSVVQRDDADDHKPKKRRLHGACDGCRKKKIKCDSAETQPNKCTNCRASRIECTHDMPRQPKKSEAQAAYILSLEETIEKMRRLLHAVYPEKDLQILLEKSIDELPEAKSSPGHSVSSPAASTPSSMSSVKLPKMSSLSQEITHLTASPPASDDEEDDPDDFAHLELAEHLKELSIDALEDRFFGRSSSFMFFKEAATLRAQLAGMPQSFDSSKFRRPMYWDVRPWETDYTALPNHPPSYEYPEDDLMRSLVFIYFEKFNPLFPLLHKPTFIRMLAENRHLKDPNFGTVVLMVCALASRYSHDPRVFSSGSGAGDGEHGGGLSSGWKWFRQVPLHRRNLLYRANLFDLQYYVLATMYFIGTSIPHNSWNILGVIIRYLYEMGGHRRKPHSQKPTADEELMKRIFWCVLYLDRMMASFLGRPSLIQDEDYDVDFPIECDDEYWDPPDPKHAFKQPPGKPSYITAFVCNLKLSQILGLALRTMYATKKSKVLAGMVGEDWEQRIVAELDSSLNKWKDSVPAFLQWDPEREDSTFFHQSVSIHASFYYVQIQIHRPFLMKKTPLSLPSLAMCTNAARSCARLLEVSLTRGIRVMPHIIIAAFCSGTVIVLNLWGIRHSGLLGDAAKETINLQKCINVLKECEKRWHVAGRSCDMLREVGSLEDYDEATALPKRRWDDAEVSTGSRSAPQHSSINTPFAQQASSAYSLPYTALGATQAAESVMSPSGSGNQTFSSASASHAATSLTHSMAIPQVASSSSCLADASISPPEAASALAQIPMPMYNTAPNPLATDWDLGNLLMMQMGYGTQYQDNPPTQFNIGLPNSNMAGQQDHHPVNAQQNLGLNNNTGTPMPLTGIPARAAFSSMQPTSAQFASNPGAQETSSASPESVGNTEDLLSLFSDVPMAFSLEEWDAYLANIGS